MSKLSKLNAVAASVVLGAVGVSTAHAGANPFAASDLAGGYQQLASADQGKDAEGKCGEGKCGEGKCGGESKDDAKGGGKDDGKKPEGKCGEGKCGEGMCGEMK